MVFITASPVLTNEVRRFYSGIKGKLLTMLRARDEARRERKKKEAGEKPEEKPEEELKDEEMVE